MEATSTFKSKILIKVYSVITDLLTSMKENKFKTKNSIDLNRLEILSNRTKELLAKEISFEIKTESQKQNRPHEPSKLQSIYKNNTAITKLKEQTYNQVLIEAKETNVSDKLVNKSYLNETDHADEKWKKEVIRRIEKALVLIQKASQPAKIDKRLRKPPKLNKLETIKELDEPIESKDILKKNITCLQISKSISPENIIKENNAGNLSYCILTNTTNIRQGSESIVLPSKDFFKSTFKNSSENLSNIHRQNNMNFWCYITQKKI